jgi:glyoxylase-like metal-dependent hydrolase (beta-lactamase superfamily II)
VDNRTEPLGGGVWRIEVAASTNAYLVARDGTGDRDGLVLVDTGTHASGPRLVRSVRMLGFDPRRIDEVVLTCWHPWHAGSAARFAASSARPVLRAGRQDADAAGGRCPATRATRPSGLLRGTRRRPAPVHVQALDAGKPTPYGMVAIPAPGPTTGHHAFWFPATGLLLAGDVVRNLPLLWTGPRALHDEPGVLPDTLGRLADLTPSVVACGHGPPVRRDAAARLRKAARRAGTRVP